MRNELSHFLQQQNTRMQHYAATLAINTSKVYRNQVPGPVSSYVHAHLHLSTCRVARANSFNAHILMNQYKAVAEYQKLNSWRRLLALCLTVKWWKYYWLEAGGLQVLVVVVLLIVFKRPKFSCYYEEKCHDEVRQPARFLDGCNFSFFAPMRVCRVVVVFSLIFTQSFCAVSSCCGPACFPEQSELAQ